MDGSIVITDPVRICSKSDLAEMVVVGMTAYGQRFPRMTVENLTIFLLAAIDHPNALVIRTNNCFGAMVAEIPYYDTKPYTKSVYLVSRKPDMAIIRIATTMLEWSERIGAVEAMIESVTDHDLDALGRYLGLDKRYTCWVKMIGGDD
jgi:hypothetical protein